VDPALVNIALALGLLLVAYFSGSWIERRHYRSIRRREVRWSRLPAITFARIPADWEVLDGGLVAGNVVVSVDHFKRFLAGLRGLVGGRIKSYESLLDRSRREAILRLKKDAMDRGFHAVVNVRVETSRMANSRRNGEGTAGVEVLAFGTGLKLKQRPV
jgi:uncharacterized protein YbjQ (UPF0145 family)